MTQKTLRYGDRTLIISGSESDNYFANCQIHFNSCGVLGAVMKHHVRPGATIIDVGANIGLTTLLAHCLVADARIVSIEPSGVFPYLQETIALNEVRNHVAVHCCIGAEDGQIAFNSVCDNSSASHIGGTELMPMRSLDSLALELDLTHVDFVKIDVEGFEAGVLDGMRQINNSFRPLIFMEFNAYTINAIADQSPVRLLRRIVSEYGCFLANTTGTDLEVVRASGVQAFLARHMSQRGCVEDIIFSADPVRITAFQLPG